MSFKCKHFYVFDRLEEFSPLVAVELVNERLDDTSDIKNRETYFKHTWK